jgi:hypothetical protein
VTESDYWGRLEYRVTSELAGIDEYRRLGLWCDGFIPDVYELEVDVPQVSGTAWVCPGQDQQAWRFALLLPARCMGREAINWASLLPADDETGWLTLDLEGRYLEVEPGAAVKVASQQAAPADGASRRR